jgi:hypothetical protein
MTNTKNIKNGSLYFNQNENRVERVLGKVNTQRVWTKFHKEETKDVETKHLNKASNQAVDDYLGAKTRKTAMEKLPPLPQIGVIG